MPPRPARRPRRKPYDRRVLAVPRIAQPDAVSCGPTCLLQVYRYWGDGVPFGEVRGATRVNPDGGTLAVYLGLSALGRGYRARIYPFDPDVFDPTWSRLAAPALRAKLRRGARAVRRGKLRDQILAYDEFLARGGEVAFRELTPALLVGILDRGRPILTGLSATWLYRQSREIPETNVPDDVRGEPTGHFVVVCGYAGGGASFILRDPEEHVPFSRTGRYTVPAGRLVGSILLGATTYDADLLELWPPRAGRR
jgi:hypothetical protein